MKVNSWLSSISKDQKLPNYTSQRGEDRILAKILQIVGVESRWCVEFGAADGKRGSNTWHLINDLNWSGVQIEAKRDRDLKLNQKRDTYEALIDRYGKNERVVCLNEYVRPYGENSLDSLLARTKIPRKFDVLSVDVDSSDYAIWEGLHNYQPQVVLIEHNKTIPVEVDFYSDRGSSLAALARLGQEKGYELVAATIVNAVFVRREHFEKFEIADNSPREIWPEHEQFRKYIFQLYDGTVVLYGDPKLRWMHGVEGTLEGQIRAGKFLWLRSGMRTINDRLRKEVTTLVSGRVRQVAYKVLERL